MGLKGTWSFLSCMSLARKHLATNQSHYTALRPVVRLVCLRVQGTDEMSGSELSGAQEHGTAKRNTHVTDYVGRYHVPPPFSLQSIVKP